MEYKGRVNEIRFNFPMMNCRVGEQYEATLTFEVTEMSKRGTTVQILDLKTTGDAGTKRTPQIIPSPS